MNDVFLSFHLPSQEITAFLKNSVVYTNQDRTSPVEHLGTCWSMEIECIQQYRKDGMGSRLMVSILSRTPLWPSLKLLSCQEYHQFPTPKHLRCRSLPQIYRCHWWTRLGPVGFIFGIPTTLLRRAMVYFVKKFEISIYIYFLHTSRQVRLSRDFLSLSLSVFCMSVLYQFKDRQLM